jgi:hypothetical protein
MEKQAFIPVTLRVLTRNQAVHLLPKYGGPVRELVEPLEESLRAGRGVAEQLPVVSLSYVV